VKIAIGCDVAGYDLKCVIKSFLEDQGHQLIDVGMTDKQKTIPFYEVAANVARLIQNQQAEKGFLFCGTGMGVAIVANKFKGVYAAVVESSFAGKMCAAINKANVITMGGWIVGPKLAIDIADHFLATGFTEGLEDIRGFLTQAVEEIRQIEDMNFSAQD
jgi:ribose 5-phosphate isomerase B